MYSKRRVMLDTNIYGYICELANARDIVFRIANKSVVCGSAVIRKELRNISKNKKVGSTKLRIRALEFYDILVSDKRNYAVNELIRKIASEYNLQYVGSIPAKELEADFIIVATASLHGADIVVSNDMATMLSEDSITAYVAVNKKFEINTPKFLPFENFISQISK
jgi:predicted nucleic acid-binding protein